MKDSYDVVVIGAGVGGLTAGALLAQKGLSVAVFEKGLKPGGYCTSFRRKGYTFDACLDAVSGCGEGGWLRRVLQRLRIENDVEFARLDPLRVDSFGGERVEIPAGVPALLDLLYALAPGEKGGISGLIGAMEDIYRAAMVTPPEVLYKDPRLDGRPGALSRYRRLTYKDLLDDFVKDQRVRAVMSDRAAFMGLPPSKVSAVAMATMFMTYAAGGGYRIKNGAGRLADALVKGLEAAGGEIYFRSPVEGITTDDGKASGVVADGRTVAAKAVVSAVDSSKTFSLAGMAGEPAGLKPSVSFFMVYLGLDKDLGVPDSMGLYPGYDIEGTFLDIGKDIASPRSSLELVNYSGISPDMAPAGRSTVMLMAKAAYRYREDWHACKRGEMDRLIKLADRAVPGIRESITYAEAATPLTLERYTGNSQGAAFGWEQGVKNMRPGARTALPGLCIAGHWTYPGGGVESVAASGIIAAEKASAAMQEGN